MAMDHGMTILTADHTRKANGFFIDPIDDIMGNTSKSRALDSVLAIYKEQGKAGAVLRGRGRETEEIDLALLWDPITACWQSQGPADGVRMTEAYEQIITYLAESGKSQVGSIANGLGKDRGNTFRHLQDLVNAGKLRKESIENKVYYENIQK